MTAIYTRWAWGWQVLQTHAGVLAWVWLVGFGAGGLWALTLPRSLHRYRHIAVGWPLAGLLAILGGHLPSEMRFAAGWVLAALGAGACLWWARRVVADGHGGLLLLLGGLTALVLPWGLASTRHLLVPPYSDPAVHYALLQTAYTDAHLPNVPFSIAWVRLVNPYWFYHLGFHGLLEWYVWAHGMPPALAMLAAAHLLVVWVLPTGMYWLAWAAWQRRGVALGVAWAAVLGWSMPLYSLNWGKYPALLGIAAAPAMLFLGWEIARAGSRRAWVHGGVAWLALLWAHARVAALTLLWGGAGAFRRWASQRLAARRMRQAVLAGLWLWSTAGALALLARGQYWRFHSPAGFLGLPAAAACLLWRRRQPTAPLWAGMAGWAVFIIAAWIPIPKNLHHGVALVDRPLFEMLTPLLLSWLGGGVAVACLPTAWRQAPQAPWRWGFWLALGGLVAVLSWQHAYRVRADVVFFQEDDAEAMAFLQRLATPDAVVLVHTRADDGHPTDGGAWITPQLGLATEGVPAAVWWEVSLVRDACARHTSVWAYVDEAPRGFALPPELPYLSLAIFTPTVKVYRVHCEIWQPAPALP